MQQTNHQQARGRQIVLLLAALLLLVGALVAPGRARATTPTPAAPAPFTLRITDETARGNPLAGVTVVFSVTTGRSGAVERVTRQTDAQGEIVLPEAQPPEVIVLKAFDDTQRDYYLPANNLETMALHLPTRGTVVPLARVDPNRLTFDYRLMPEPVEITPGLVVTATPVPVPLAVRVAAGRSTEQANSSGSTLPLIVLGALAVGIAAVPSGVWLWRLLRSEHED